MRGGSFAGDAGERVLPEKQTFDAERLFGCETVFFRTPSLHEFSRVGAFYAAEGGIVAQLQSLQSWKCLILHSLCPMRKAR